MKACQRREGAGPPQARTAPSRGSGLAALPTSLPSLAAAVQMPKTRLTPGPGSVRPVWVFHVWADGGGLPWPSCGFSVYPALACGDLSPRESEQGCVSAKASPEDHPPTEQPVAMGGGTVADRQLLMELNPNMVRVYSEASASPKRIWKHAPCLWLPNAFQSRAPRWRRLTPGGGGGGKCRGGGGPKVDSLCFGVTCWS